MLFSKRTITTRLAGSFSLGKPRGWWHGWDSWNITQRVIFCLFFTQNHKTLGPFETGYLGGDLGLWDWKEKGWKISANPLPPDRLPFRLWLITSILLVLMISKRIDSLTSSALFSNFFLSFRKFPFRLFYFLTKWIIIKPIIGFSLLQHQTSIMEIFKKKNFF